MFSSAACHWLVWKGNSCSHYWYDLCLFISFCSLAAITDEVNWPFPEFLQVAWRSKLTVMSHHHMQLCLLLKMLHSVARFVWKHYLSVGQMDSSWVTFKSILKLCWIWLNVSLAFPGAWYYCSAHQASCHWRQQDKDTRSWCSICS